MYSNLALVEDAYYHIKLVTTERPTLSFLNASLMSEFAITPVADIIQVLAKSYEIMKRSLEFLKPANKAFPKSSKSADFGKDGLKQASWFVPRCGLKQHPTRS
ncbi:MAG: hypothetical protein DBP03_18455 [gamma proteobacterium symbiont of Ctena orbiculata]|nr:MAG: hypothetical protein DBP03_18455 [gamma proteobacterium symbiont of Ctena orbiculata]